MLPRPMTAILIRCLRFSTVPVGNSKRAMDADTSAERSARNEDAFRKANERIQLAAVEFDADEALPFLCECPDPACIEMVRLTLGQYAQVRAHPRRFVVASGHESGNNEV